MILLMGLPGSGKGTQSKLLAEKDGYTVVSTGELLRRYGSEAQHERMKKGEILGDEEVTVLLAKALSETQDPDHTILDGFPRRITQVEWLLEEQRKGRFAITSVVYLVATQEAVVARLLERGRLDDNGEGIARRFKEYEADTLPVLNYLKSAGIRVKEVNAEGTIEDVHNEIVNWLKESDA